MRKYVYCIYIKKSTPCNIYIEDESKGRKKLSNLMCDWYLIRQTYHVCTDCTEYKHTHVGVRGLCDKEFNLSIYDTRVKKTIFHSLMATCLDIKYI